MDLLIFIGVIVLTMLLVLIVKMAHIIPQDRRFVIHRFGRLHRITGPGLRFIVPFLETIERVIEVRDHPEEIPVPGVFAFGITNDLTLNLFYRFDPVEAAQGDHDKMVKILQINDEERHRQVAVKVREALVNQISILQKRNPLSDQATVLDGLVALAPGSDHYTELIQGTKEELETTLPLLGIILNTHHPITLTYRGLPEDVVKAIKRKQGRDIDSQWLAKYAGNLQKLFPTIPQNILGQILSSIEGVEMGNVQRLHLEQGAGNQAEVEFELSLDKAGPNIVTKPQNYTTASSKVIPPEASKPPLLTKSDLEVLKRVPHYNQDQTLSA